MRTASEILYLPFYFHAFLFEIENLKHKKGLHMKARTTAKRGDTAFACNDGSLLFSPTTYSMHCTAHATLSPENQCNPLKRQMSACVLILSTAILSYSWMF